MQTQFPPPVPIVVKAIPNPCCPIALLVVQGFYAPTPLLLLYGPWITERSLLCRN